MRRSSLKQLDIFRAIKIYIELYEREEIRLHHQETFFNRKSPQLLAFSVSALKRRGKTFMMLTFPLFTFFFRKFPFVCFVVLAEYILGKG